jgi:hypothetical protein
MVFDSSPWDLPFWHSLGAMVLFVICSARWSGGLNLVRVLNVRHLVVFLLMGSGEQKILTYGRAEKNVRRQDVQTS